MHVFGILYIFAQHFIQCKYYHQCKLCAVCCKSSFPTAKLFVPLYIEIKVLFRDTGSNNLQSSLEILVVHRTHLKSSYSMYIQII